MAFDAEAQAVFTNVIAGLPKVAELIATIPEERQAQALAAAEQSYRSTARALGCDESDARQWAAEVMAQLRAMTERTGKEVVAA